MITPGISIESRPFATDYYYRGLFNDGITNYEFIIRDEDGEDLEITWENESPVNSEEIEISIMKEFSIR